MPTMAIGQITITDMWDAPGLNAWISASQATSQTYNNTTQVHSPSYTASAQVLTLNLTKAGNTVSLLGANVPNVKWYKHLGGVKSEIASVLNTDNEYKSGTSHSVLSTKVNIPTDKHSVRYSVEGVFNDPSSGLSASFSAEIDLILVHLAKAAVIGNIYAPDGDFFRNNTPASLIVNADLYKDGSLAAGSKKFKWFAADSTVGTAQDADAGVGWRKITATSGVSGSYANVGFDVAVTTQGILTVFPDAVINGQTFMCVITDNAGGTSGTKVKLYLTLRDMDDPILVIVDSSGGSVIKNGSGSTTLTARVFRNGEEIDTGETAYTYKWSKWQNNAMNANFGGTGNAYKTGKTLSVGSSDVNAVTTFKVEVS